MLFSFRQNGRDGWGARVRERERREHPGEKPAREIRARETAGLVKIVSPSFNSIAIATARSSSSSSSFTNSFLAESSTVSERGGRLPYGGRAVRRHDDGDGSERRRCCGHSEHAARTFGAFHEKRRGRKERRIRERVERVERKREREKGTGQRRRSAARPGDHVYPAVLPAHARSATRLVSQYETHICTFMCRARVYTCAYVYTCDATRTVSTNANARWERGERASKHLPQATRCD